LRESRPAKRRASHRYRAGRKCRCKDGRADPAEWPALVGNRAAAASQALAEQSNKPQYHDEPLPSSVRMRSARTRPAATIVNTPTGQPSIQKPTSALECVKRVERTSGDSPLEQTVSANSNQSFSHLIVIEDPSCFPRLCLSLLVFAVRASCQPAKRGGRDAGAHQG